MQGIYIFVERIMDLVSMDFFLDLLSWILTMLKARHGYLRNVVDCAISNQINIFKSKQSCVYHVVYIA